MAGNGDHGNDLDVAEFGAINFQVKIVMDRKTSRPCCVKVKIDLVCTGYCWENQSLRLRTSVSSNCHFIKIWTRQWSWTYYCEHNGCWVCCYSCNNAACLLIGVYLHYLTHVLVTAGVAEPSCLINCGLFRQSNRHDASVWTSKGGGESELKF